MKLKSLWYRQRDCLLRVNIATIQIFATIEGLKMDNRVKQKIHNVKSKIYLKLS